jgi:tRNA(fMet)-specific endonuclease VapC
MRFLLDTNTCIYIIKRKPSWVVERFSSLAVESIGVSSVTVSELWYGVCKSRKVEQNREALTEFLLPLAVAPYDERAAFDYGAIRASLERSGKTIGPLDLMIAAHARSLAVTLVTNNVDEFGRVEGLSIENWA